MLVLFLVVAIVFAWIVYQFNWMRQRSAIISNPSYSYSDGSYGFGLVPNAPWPLRMFGATGFISVSLIIVDPDEERFPGAIFVDMTDPGLTADERLELERMASLFPEADVRAHIVLEINKQVTVPTSSNSPSSQPLKHLPEANQ